MPIRINPAPTFTAKIPFSVAGQEAPEVVSFEMRHKSPDALKLWVASFPGRDTADVLADVVVRWTSGVIDDDGAELPFTVDNLARFLAAHGPRATDLLRGYTRELTESRQKN